MTGQSLRIHIDGFNITVEVDGVEGDECLKLTEFLTLDPSAKVQDQQMTQEVKRIKVPVEVRLP